MAQDSRLKETTRSQRNNVLETSSLSRATLTAESNPTTHDAVRSRAIVEDQLIQDDEKAEQND